MSFVLHGSNYVDLLNLGEIPIEMLNLDDSKIGTLNIWSSEKCKTEIGKYKKIVATGTCTIPLCKVNNNWQFLTINGSDTFSTSLITPDKEGLILPKLGVYIITLTIFETAKTNPSAYSIQQKNIDPASITTTIYNLVGGGNNTQCHRIMFLNENDQISFRVWQQQSCNTLVNFVWCIQLLDS